MATRITPEQIEEINEVYVELGVKAQVARKMGISPSTVSRYIIPDYVPKSIRVTSHCEVETSFPIELFMGEYGQMGQLCVLSEEEKAELIELQKEVMI